MTQREEIIQQAIDYVKANGPAKENEYFARFYQEIEPRTFKDSGYYRTFDGYNIPAFLFPAEERFRIFGITDDLKVKDFGCWMDSQKVSFAPFLSCVVWFFNTGVENPCVVDHIVDIDGRSNPSQSYYSKNGYANFMFQYGSLYNLKIHRERRADDIYTFLKRETANDMWFFHLLYDYGWGNSVKIEYRFDDLLDMDVTSNDFLWFDLQYLKEECRRYQLIKESLNFKIFERPLTDEEKFKCASKFFKSYDKLIKAHSMGKTSKFKNHYATR